VGGIVRDFNERHKATVSVQSHDDLMAALRNREAHAATYCCDRPECRRRAIAWALYWTGFAVVLAIGIARVLKQPENVEETLREQVRQERLAAAPWN
jgi:hypothetical protein